MKLLAYYLNDARHFVVEFLVVLDNESLETVSELLYFIGTYQLNVKL